MSALDEAADDDGACFEEVTVSGGEGCGVVAVDVDFADDFAVGVDGHDDFGFGFDGAGEIARVGMDVVYDDRLILRDGGSADALVNGMRVCSVGAPRKGPRTSISASLGSSM